MGKNFKSHKAKEFITEHTEATETNAEEGIEFKLKLKLLRLVNQRFFDPLCAPKFSVVKKSLLKLNLERLKKSEDVIFTSEDTDGLKEKHRRENKVKGWYS